MSPNDKTGPFRLDELSLELIEKSELIAQVSTFPFRPQPALEVGISIQGLAIGGWNQSLFLDYQLLNPKNSQASELFLQLFHQTHPELSFAELAGFYFQWQQLISKDVLIPHFSKIYELYLGKWDAEIGQGLEQFMLLPESFQKWAHERKVVGADLIPLFQTLADKKISVSNHLFHLAQRNPSRSEGSKALEWVCELLMLDTGSEALLSVLENSAPTDWLKALESLRYPNTKIFDDSQADVLRQVQSTKGVRYRWVRQGDKAYVEVSGQLAQSSDADRLIESLSLNKELFKSHLEKQSQP